MSAVGGERETLAELVQARRRALGLTRAALAAHTGVAVRTLTPSPATLAPLAAGLGLSVEALRAATPRGEIRLTAARPHGCLGCGRPHGAVRQALLARVSGRGPLWLCHDCAAHEQRVAALLAAYRRERGAGERRRRRGR